MTVKADEFLEYFVLLTYISIPRIATEMEAILTAFQ